MDELADALGVTVKYSDLYKNLLGMYFSKWRRRYIFLNSNMDENMKRMVLAHEIGHDALHRDIASGHILKEFNLFNMKDMSEYEANAFASHLLIPEDDLRSLIEEGYDIAGIASILGVNINLVLIKLQELNRLGNSIYVLPDSPRGDFLKGLDCDGSARS